METYHFQVEHCAPYGRYVSLIGAQVERFEDIPFLPIELFKTQKIYCSKAKPEATFTSSGTTGSETSRHYVASLKLYEQSFINCFRYFYGEPSEYSIFSLLPSYLEREGSSLAYMAEYLHKLNPTKGGFYLYDFSKLATELSRAKDNGEKILLLGVTFALLDFAEQFRADLSGTVVMETGGMKGRKREIPREELHKILCNSFNVDNIHSEYGMTEMLSQGYSRGGGVFRCPPWVDVSLRSLQNPLASAEIKGGINIIDLANRHSCSFLATGDYGRLNEDGSFEIAGRISGEQLRGCNMLYH